MRVTNPAHPTLLGPVPGQIYAGIALAKILRRQEHTGQYAPSGATRACASIEIRLAQSDFLGGAGARDRMDGPFASVTNPCQMAAGFPK